jgi:hypothetical protein
MDVVARVVQDGIDRREVPRIILDDQDSGGSA